MGKQQFLTEVPFSLIVQFRTRAGKDLEKGQLVSILGFAGHVVSVMTAQLCCSMKAALDINKGVAVCQ